jgi:hypothetical protein
MIKAEIQGTDSILKELDAIGKSIESGEVQKILRQSGQALVASARNMAPHRTGALRKSIGFINKNDKQYPLVVLIGIRQGFSRGKNNDPGKYGNILQQDSRSGQRRALKFMDMAMQINGAKVKENIERGLIELIEKSKKKI